MTESKPRTAVLRWLPALFVLVGVVGAGAVFHREVLDWFGVSISGDSAADEHSGQNEGSHSRRSTPASSEKATAPINKTCPILGNAVPEDAKTVTWDGHTIGFCCPPCEDGWNKLPDEKKQEFVDKSLSTSAANPNPMVKEEKPLPPKDSIAFWTCSMHPSVKSKDKGTCPICKMDLTPVTHEEVTSGVVFVDARRRQLIGVRTTAVMEQDLVKTIRAKGVVTYDETRLKDVSLKFRGWVGELFADYTGKQVKEGETLFTIYSPELFSAQQEFLDAVSSQKGTERSGRLLESARNRLLLWDLKESQLEELSRGGKPLQYVPILSPVTGTVIHKMAVSGSAVEAGSMVYRIADLSVVWVEAELYQSEVPLVSEGQEATASVSYLPGRTFETKVSYVYPYLDQKTRRGRVRLEVKNPDGALKPEMFANVYLEIPLGKKLAVPEEAVLYGGENNVVFLDLGEGRMRPQRVKLGARATDVGLGMDLVEVIDGLKPGETVVTSGNFLVASESKIKSGIDKW